MIVEVLNLQEAKDLLRFCLGGGGKVKPTSHFFDELENEELTIPNAWHVLRSGNITESPEQDIKTREWKYRIEGHEPDGKWVVIVFCFKTIEHVCLITIFSVESRRRP